MPNESQGSAVEDAPESKLFSCDACSNAFFMSEVQLDEHVRARHSKDLYPQFEALTEAATQANAQWEVLSSLPAVQQKLSQWGAKAFSLASKRDGGEAKMREAHAARAQLEIAVQRWLPSCNVYIFGSSVALGVWDGTSDVDFTVVDVAALEQGAWNPNEKNAVRSIAQVLFRAGFSHQNLELIPYARVPIIKHYTNTPLIPFAALEAMGHLTKDGEQVVARSARFSLASPANTQDRLLLEASVHSAVSPNAIQQLWWDRKGTEMCVTFSSTTESMRALTSTPATSPANRCMKVSPLHEEHSPELFHIDFDLSFRVFGIRNSQLLRQYLLAHPCARPGSLVLKDWSKTSGVNNSHAGFLTSYAINILWIYFLVQRGVVPYVDPLDIPSSLASAQHACDPTYTPMQDATLADDQLQALHATMGSLLLDFFRYYSCEFNWQAHVVSLNRPGVTTKEQLAWDEEDVQQGRKHTRYSMCIEDPYEENLNLGRHLGPTKTNKVLQELRRGFLSLLKDSTDESCVFELTDNANTEELLPPAAAVVTLVSACLVAFEDAAMHRDAAVVGVGEDAAGATMTSVGTDAKQSGAGVVCIGSEALRKLLMAQAPAELELALKCWSWHQLLHRLGYKVMGGMVYRRGTLGKRPTVAGSSPSHGSAGSAAERVRDALLDRIEALPPDAAQWTPESDPLPKMYQQRCVRVGGHGEVPWGAVHHLAVPAQGVAAPAAAPVFGTADQIVSGRWPQQLSQQGGAHRGGCVSWRNFARRDAAAIARTAMRKLFV